MRDLTTGSEFKVILAFAIPMLIGNVFQQLYNTVDSIIVGNFIGKEALAAVGASSPVIFLLVALAMGVGMGASIMISQYFGAKQMENLKATIETFYILSAVLCVIITACGIIFAGPILSLMNTPPDVFESARTYMVIFFSGMVFLFGFNGIGAILRGMGDSKTPLYFLIVATVVNIILDLVFVTVFKMGVAGVASATIIAEAVTFIGGFIVLQKSHPLLRLDLRKLEFSPKLLGKMVRISLPTGIQQMLVAASFMVLTGLVQVFGTDVQAGFTSAGRIDSFAIMPVMSLSMALSSFTGQNVGAKRLDRVIKGFRISLFASIIFSLLLGGVFLLWGDRLVAMFNQEPNVILHGSHYLHIIGMFYWIVAIMFVVQGVTRGTGDTVVPMLISLLTLWLFRVPLAHYLSGLIGPDGIWWAIPLAWGFGGTASLVYYLMGRWKKKSVISRPPEMAPVAPNIPENAADTE
ncbi:MAG: MATE family efflux transporter [Spirochaetes bacterium GWF1_51_8]|nr:MAG: MATE family efflux transporter [Spirochaetes bacterium GWF1_51_8]